MYQLLVTSLDGSWDSPVYHFPVERFCEHTLKRLKDRFAKLTKLMIEELKTFPAVFAYEGESEKHIVRVGYIQHIEKRGNRVKVEYDFDESIPAFPFSKIAAFKSQLHIEESEMYRTHWAIKNKDLFEVLNAAGIITRTPARLVPLDQIQFKVALSFPGEHREYVKAVADQLKSKLGPDAVFYDDDFKSQLAIPNLDTLLQQVYRNKSDLIVIFACAKYQEKEWCGIEWRAVRDIIKKRKDHSVMFLRFDDAPIDGMFSIDGSVDLSKHTPIETASMIVERVLINEARSRV